MSPRAGLDADRIVSKATEIIDMNGVDKLTLGILASELNVRTPSLYNHVKSLDGLKQALAIQGLNKLYQQMQKAAIGRSGDTAIREISEAYLCFVRSHPGLYEATFRAPEPEDSNLQQAQDQIVELVVLVMREYDLSHDTVLHLVRGLRSILHGFTSIEQMGGFGLPLDLDQSFTILLDTYIKGIHLLKKEQGSRVE
ncbi:TetR/AcrR family transcriptional regulator [Caldalkalibacillus mannanilyticus]|uniref:TetR/AcrR family transcriptional regulator n=1 Tax=Caldalkalibacillus mannanilyticus TaxID=1418 RepID=UPI000469A993|nr:TetR/AcrR family transcriptional regulator [Caldalkalibacillus mannanilyticus]